MARKKYKDGDVIFREGDPSDIAFAIESGTVELTKAGDSQPVQLALLRKGEMFGEMGILDNSLRSATAVAVGNVTLKVISREEFLDTLENEPDMALSVIGKLVERLRNADEMLVQRSAREAVAKVRRDPAHSSKPGFFQRLLGGAGVGGATGARIEVRVAQLEGEGGAQRAQMVVAALDRNKLIRARIVKKVLAPEAALATEQGVIAATDTGRQWLSSLKADLLVWGVVPPPGASMHLHFIPLTREKADRPGTFGAGTTLALPAEFSAEFDSVLAAVVLAATAPKDQAQAQAIRQALPEVLETAMPVVQEQPVDLVSRERAAIHVCFANAVATAAHFGGAIEMYQVAANSYRTALEGLSSDNDPIEWAMTQKHLGAVLQALADRTSDPETIGAAANVFRSALRVLTRQEHPFEWASVQYRLGQVLYRLDLKSGETDFLKEALTAFQSALHVFTRKEDALRWAEIMNSIGQTAQVLGREMRNPELLEKAAEACDNALEVRTRNEHPLLYAATQNNLGSALFQLGRLTGKPTYYTDAAQAFDRAKETYVAENHPKMAAITHKNLAHVEELLPPSVRKARQEPTAWFEDEGGGSSYS